MALTGDGTSQSTATAVQGSAGGVSQGRSQGAAASVGDGDKVLERLKALGEFMKRRLQRRRHTAAVRFHITPNLSIAVHVRVLQSKEAYQDTIQHCVLVVGCRAATADSSH
jgi:hypothetical protein